jgi:hypothetical protein
MSEVETVLQPSGAGVKKPMSRAAALFAAREQGLEEQSRNATLTLWISLGSILCLVLSCLVGSFMTRGGKFGGPIGVMILLLIVSVLIYFLAGRNNERWYVVCILLNQAGIGLATLVVIATQVREINLLNLLLSGVPVAAVLFGVVVFFNSTASENRSIFLIVGLCLLAFVMIFSIIRFTQLKTEFWMSMAVNALMSCGGLGALLWANGNWGSRSVLKGLTVASFAIFLVMAVVAIIAFYIFIKSQDDSDTDISFGRSKDSDSGGGILGGRSRSRSKGISRDSFEKTGSGVRSAGAAAGSGGGTRSGGSGGIYIDPYYIWYYTPSFGSRTSTLERMSEMDPEEQKKYCRKLRIRKILYRILSVVVVLGLIAGAVILGGLY